MPTAHIKPFLAGFTEVVSGAALYAPGSSSRPPVMTRQEYLAKRLHKLDQASSPDKFRASLEKLEHDFLDTQAADKIRLKNYATALMAGQITGFGLSLSYMGGMILLAGHGAWPWLVAGAWLATIVASLVYWSRRRRENTKDASVLRVGNTDA